MFVLLLKFNGISCKHTIANLRSTINKEYLSILYCNLTHLFGSMCDRDVLFRDQTACATSLGPSLMKHGLSSGPRNWLLKYKIYLGGVTFESLYNWTPSHIPQKTFAHPCAFWVECGPRYETKAILFFLILLCISRYLYASIDSDTEYRSEFHQKYNKKRQAVVLMHGRIFPTHCMWICQTSFRHECKYDLFRNTKILWMKWYDIYEKT